MPTDPSVLLALASLLTALVHVVVARRRELGPLVITLGGVAWLWTSASPSSEVGPFLGLAALAQAGAWARGARGGVGRPDLVGWTLATLVVATVLPTIIVPIGWTSVRVHHAAAPLLGFVGIVCTGLALRRPRLPGLRVWHHRDVPVEGP